MIVYIIKESIEYYTSLFEGCFHVTNLQREDGFECWVKLI